MRARLTLSQAVRETTVFVEFEIVHEPSSCSNIAIVQVFFTYLRFLLPDPPEGPSLNLEVSHVAAMTPPNSLS